MSAETKTEPHRIEWRISRWGYVKARVICEAQQDAYCRTYCVQDCETACDHDEVSGPCFLLPWFDDTSMIPETYDGPDDTVVHDGPIVIAISHAEEASWRYAEPAEPAAVVDQLAIPAGSSS